MNTQGVLTRPMARAKSTIYVKNGGELRHRICWECNKQHEYLRYVTEPFICSICEKWYCKGVDITK